MLGGRGRTRSGGGYGGGGSSAGGGGMSKRGGGTRRGGRFLSIEEEERLRGNVIRRNSMREREEGSKVSATEEMEQMLVENLENESVAGRVRRLEGGQGGTGQSQGSGQGMARGQAPVDGGREGGQGAGGQVEGSGQAPATGNVPVVAQPIVNVEESMRDEFDFGRRMAGISDQLRRSVGAIVDRISGQGLDAEGIKAATVEGLRVMMESVEAVMNGMSDAVQSNRIGSERVEREIKTRVQIVEGRTGEVENKLEVLKRAKDRQVWKESVQTMTERIALGDRQLKYVNIDYGRATNSRREIVEKTIAYMKEDIDQGDVRRLETIMRRTRFILLGKETVLSTHEDQRIHTIPILLEFRSVNDKVEVEDMLREVGWYPVYHWPRECMEFVKEARFEVRRMGFQEDNYFVKIRPDWKDGSMEIRGEVKENRVGGKFRTVAVWDVPPADVNLWTREQAKPRKTFALGGR